MFVLGGLSGIYLASVPIDIHASDTYFIVAHIHYVLFGGSVFTIFAGVYFWFPKMTGRMYDERLGRLHFWLTFIGFNATFFPMHLIGLDGMPRRVADYAPRFADFNLFISIASFLLGASTLVFFYNMIKSWRSGPPAPGEPVARADAGVARQLAAADLQLRRDPAGRRRAVRVRRPGRAPRGARAARRCTPSSRRSGASIERAAPPRRRERDRRQPDADRRDRGAGERGDARHGDRADHAIPAPATSSTPTRAAPPRGAGSTGRWRSLREAGILASGLVVDADPAAAVRDAIAQEEPPVTRSSSRRTR